MTILSAPQIATYARNAGFTGVNVPIAVAVALAESGGRTDVTHSNSDGSTDYGVWQINSVHHDILATGNWRDPAANARMAFAVWKRQGWSAWSTYKSGAYLKHYSGDPGSAPVPVQTVGVASDLASGTILAPSTWLRIASFLAGVFLIVVAIWRATGVDTGGIVKTAVKVAAVA